jgi:hypothetical protein
MAGTTSKDTLSAALIRSAATPGDAKQGQTDVAADTEELKRATGASAATQFKIRVCKLDNSIFTFTVSESTTVDDVWKAIAATAAQRAANNLLLTRTMTKLVPATATLTAFGVTDGSRLDVVPKPRT